MSILGQLIVELRANTASFIEGLNGAAKTTRTVGREIESSFSSLGSIAASALGSFGPLGFAVSQTLEKIGSSAGAAVINMGKMGGAMGAVAAVGAGAAAAVGAVAVGSLALAAHTAESIAKMGELAQSAGVSVESLSGLAFAGKSVGIETETMVKALEKMSKAAFSAATAPENAKNAFTRLGISVKDSSGHIRQADAIVADIAGKFATMPDGVTKTALAIQLFGRGGAEMIPLLNRGKNGIDEFLITAKALGVVLDEQTVQASEKFKEAMVAIEAGGQGIAIQLTKQLLPALQTLAAFLIDGLKDDHSALNFLISGFAFLTKVVLATGETIWAVLKQAGVIITGLGGTLLALFNAIGAGLEAVFKVGIGDFSGAKDALKAGYAGLKQETQNFVNNSKGIWSDYSKFTAGLVAPLPAAVHRPEGGGTDVDLGKTKEDKTLERIQERIKALQQEAVDWALVAAAGTQAEQLIAEAIKKGNAEFGKLKAEAAKDKTGAALPFVLKNEGVIRAAGEESVFGAAIKSLVGDLDKQKLKLDEQSKAALELAAAYQHGGAAIANSALGQKFAQEGAKLQVLVQAHALAETQWGKDSDIALQLGDAISRLTTSLQNNEDTARKVASDELSTELAKQSHQFAALKPYIDSVSSAYLVSEDAVRQARIELELYRFEEQQLAKGIVLTGAQKQSERKILEDADRQSYEDTLRQEAARYSLSAQYDGEITKLNRLRVILQKNGQSTLLIDAQLHDAQDKLIHQWDEAAFKVGSFRDKFRGVMGELVIQGRNAGNAMAQAWMTAIDGIETNLAKLLTGQKTNFKAVFQGLAESVTKAQIQKGVGELAGHFGLKIPGLGAKADGSSEALALWVKLANIPGLGGPASVPFGANNPFAGFGIGTGAPESGGGTLSGLGGLLSLFGGHMADGGDMSPGKWYIAGERGPEVISGPGTVTPSQAMSGGRNINNHFHYPNASSRDMFRRTEKQHAARHMRHLRLSLA